MSYEPMTWVEKVVYQKVAAAWGWLEVNGWYALGGLIAFLFLLPHIQQFIKSLRAKAYAPSADKVSDLQARQRLARLRQEEQARRAAEEHAEYERERRARQAEERADMARNLGIRARSGGRRLGSGGGDVDDDVAPPPPATSKGDDPFKRARERNPLGPDDSRGYAPARRKVNTGG